MSEEEMVRLAEWQKALRRYFDHYEDCTCIGCFEMANRLSKLPRPPKIKVKP